MKTKISGSTFRLLIIPFSPLVSIQYFVKYNYFPPYVSTFRNVFLAFSIGGEEGQGEERLIGDRLLIWPLCTYHV